MVYCFLCFSLANSKKGCTFVKQNNETITAMTTTINFPQSYKTKDEAFEFGTGDNFFILGNGEWICISRNDPEFIKMLDAGMKTEYMLYLESLNN